MTVVRILGTNSWWTSAERSWDQPEWADSGWQYCDRYGGARPWRHL